MLQIDRDVHNADWTKQTWDLPFDNVEDLREWLTSQEMSVEKFKALPVYYLNVEKLTWLKDL